MLALLSENVNIQVALNDPEQKKHPEWVRVSVDHIKGWLLRENLNSKPVKRAAVTDCFHFEPSQTGIRSKTPVARAKTALTNLSHQKRTTSFDSAVAVLSGEIRTVAQETSLREGPGTYCNALTVIPCGSAINCLSTQAAMPDWVKANYKPVKPVVHCSFLLSNPSKSKNGTTKTLTGWVPTSSFTPKEGFVRKHQVPAVSDLIKSLDDEKVAKIKALPLRAIDKFEGLFKAYDY